MLDKSKPFGRIYGVTSNKARFVQDGVSYNSDGDYADDKEKKRYIKMLQDQSEAAAAHAAKLAQESAELAAEAEASLKASLKEAKAK